MYVVPNRRVISHAVPMEGYLRGAALRSPLDLSFAFASEQTIDELAHALKMDPFEFRRRNIGDKRWLGVLEAAAKAAGWKPRVMASSLSNAEVVRGRGIGLGTHHVSYGAAVADIEVNQRTGVIVATHLYGALDCGLAVNPAAVETQIVGQMIQSVSRVLKEEVLFDKRGVTSLDWESYPVLRFAEHPAVTPVVVQRIDEPVDRRRRGSHGSDRGGDRQRLLRRHRRAAAAISDDARACAGGAGGEDLSLASDLRIVLGLLSAPSRRSRRAWNARARAA